MAALLSGPLLAPAASADVDPQRNLELNHSIELGVLEGWDVGDTVRVEIWRGSSISAGTVSGGIQIASHLAILNDANINNQGGTTYDINHIGPGAAAAGFNGSDCWDTDNDDIPNEDGIPDIQPGDLMVATELDGLGDPTGEQDYVFLRNVSFTENGDGTLDGSALGVETNGVFAPLAPIVLSGDPEAGGGILIEAKRVTAADTFDYAFVPGDIAADGSFANAGPLPGGPGGEVFIDTVDSSGGGSGNTVSLPEGSAGEDTGCGPLLSTALTSNTHPVININNQNSMMTVGGPETGPETVTSLTFAGNPYTVNHGAGSWSATIPAADVTALPEGTHLLEATLSAGGPLTESVVKDTVAPDLSASPAPGAYVGSVAVALSSNGGEAVRFTLDGSVPGASSRLYDGTPVVLGPGNHTVRAFSIDGADNRRDETFEYSVSSAPGDGGGGAGAGAGGAGVGAGAGGQFLADAQGLFRVRSLRAASRISLRRARRSGISVRFIAPAGTQAVQASLYRNTNASRHRTRRLVKRITTDATAGRLSVRFRDRRTRRKLRKGVYTISVAPSSDGTTFAEGTAKRFRIR